MKHLIRIAVVVLIVNCVPGPAHAVDFDLRGISIHAGINSSSDWDDGTTLGLTVNFAELADGLYLVGGVFRSQADASECGGFAGGFCTFELDLDVEDLALGAEVRYYLRHDPVGLYFGGGPYWHQLSIDSSGTIPGTPIGVSTSEDVNRFGAVGVAGYQLGWGFAEVRFSGVSGFDTTQLLLGFSFGGD